MKRFLPLIFAAGFVQAAVELSVSKDDGTFTAVWNGRTVVTASRPAAAEQGPGVTEVFDPNSRQMLRIPVSQTESAMTVLNKQRQRVHLGRPKTEIRRVQGGVVYTDRFPNGDAFWSVSLQPVDDNGLTCRSRSA